MPGDLQAPAYDAVLTDLQTVREQGLGSVRRLKLPHLHAACVLCDLATSGDQEPAAIEALLRQAVDTLGGGTAAEAAEYTFGLIQGTKLRPAPERRKAAARAYGLSVDRFRKAYEPTLVEQTAEGIVALCHDAGLRQAKRQMEQRHPADSRLAVRWVERFEAYYRVWTPAWALAANLEAAITTARDEPADHLPWDLDSRQPYDPIDQAQGYARYALYAYAKFKLEVKRFGTRHGGLWLLSDIEVEQQVADAVYRIGWHNPLNEDDDSWLRRTLADSRREEPEHFAQLLSATAVGGRILAEWQDFVAKCECEEIEMGEPGCQPHATIAASNEYCDLVDVDWTRIADWYRPGSEPARGITGKMLYADQIGRPRGREPI